MKYKAIIFDLDGTIIDTEHIWREATFEIIRKRGIVVTPEMKKKFEATLSGVGLKKGCLILIEMFSLSDSVEELAAEKNELVHRMLRNRLKFLHGFEQFHAKAKELNLYMGIATNAGEQTLILVEETLGIKNFFGEHIYHAALVGKYKPDPAVYLHAAEKLGFKPQECIAIEDSKHGVNAAVSAGMFCIGINAPERKELVEDAHHIVHHYDEIDLEKILGIPLKK